MLTGSAPIEPTPTGLETALKHERLIIGAGLIAITAMAWTYTVYLAVAGMVDMHLAMAEPRMHAWGGVEFFLMFIMWAVMMVAMMVPSASPMILLFATVHRRRKEQGKAYVPASVFAIGYVVIWTAFSAAATVTQWGLQQATLLSPMMKVTVPWLGAALLIAAGVFQFMPLKDACLAKCRSPMGFIMTEWREGRWGAFVMGLRHGAFCTGCCWALMALLFVGGVMNLLWVGVLTLFVLAEKVLPRGEQLGRVAGVALIAWGLWVAAKALT